MSYPGLLALFGATQGLLLTVVLMTQTSGKLLANRLLALFILAESLRLCLLAFTYDGLTLPRPEPYAALNVTMALGPLLYLYVRALTEPAFRVRSSMGWHFLPMCLLALASLRWLNGIGGTDWQTLAPRVYPTRYFFWASCLPIVGFLSLAMYALASYRLITPYKSLIAEQFSALESINLNWLRLLIFFCLATAITSASVEVLRLLTDSYLGPRVLASLLMSVAMIYSIGFMGLRQPLIFNQREAEVFTDHRFANGEKQAGKYRKSGLTTQESDILWHKLKLLMEHDQPHLQNGLKLTELADMLDVVPNHLSQIINSQSGQSFFDFINSYRLEKAQQLLREPACSGLSIAQLALEAGFNSQNTFYNQFKKRCGTTPSRFRNEHSVANQA